MNQTSLIVTSSDTLLFDQVGGLLGEAVAMHCEPTFEETRQLIAQRRPPAYVLDLRQVYDGGHIADRWIDEFQARFTDLKLIMLTAAVCPETLERRAACSPLVHLRSPVTPEEMADAVRRCLPTPTTEAPPAIPARPRETFGTSLLEGMTRKFETNSPQLKKMLEDLAIAASHNVTILLIGETGSGKTFLSKLIHEASPRRSEPFLHVACGALPRELIEGELFGHMKGSFTSAHQDKDGKFVAAGRGTVLLDEIDVLGLEQQVKLLRVIETGEFEPVGSNKTLQSQARLIAASNLDLQPLVEQMRFRPDLYYRLSMLKFEIPPLRRRKVDIIPLAKKFIAQFTVKHGIQVHCIEDSLLDGILKYPWPGNVRELEHVIQRAVIYCRDGVLSAEHLPAHIIACQVGPSNDPSVTMPGRPTSSDVTLGRQVALTEREIIEQTLFKNSFSRTKTAGDLGISRVTLYNKMRKYDLLKGD